MGHRLWLAVCLPLLLIVTPVAVIPLAQAHPYHLQVQNDVIVCSRRLDETRWLAQSFTPSSDFLISRVALRVFDEGVSDVLQVSIRTDLFGTPNTTNLTAGAADGPAFSVWLDVDLSPYVPLTAGQTYWIVARSLMPQGDGYEWWESGTESAYPNGTGANSNDGVLWGPSGTDFVFRVFGFQQPAFTFAVSPSKSIVIPGDPVVFRVNFTNTGQATSAGLWLNVSLPPEWAYVGDDAASIGGVRTGAHNYSFTDVAPGAYSFNLTTYVGGGVPNGTVVYADFAFEANDHIGSPLAQETQSVPFTIVTAVAFAFNVEASPTLLLPGENVTFRVNITQMGPASSTGLWINVSLPPELAYVADDAASIGGVRTGAHNYTFPTLPPAPYAFNFTAAAVRGVPDGTPATVTFLFTGQDGSGVPLTPEGRDATVTLRNALLDLSLALSAASVDPGDPIILTATVTNVGGAEARNLRVQGAVDVNLTYESSSPVGTYDSVAHTVRWTLASLRPGAQVALTWTGRVQAGTPDLASLRFPATVEYQDMGGTALLPIEAADRAGVRAPVFSPVLQLDRVSAGRGDRLGATLLYDNTGTGTAGEAWVNWTLGDAFALVGLSPAWSPTVTAQGFSLTLTNVTPGTHAVQAQLEVTRGMEDGRTLGLEVSWTATDKNGNPLLPARLNGTVRLDAPVVALALEAAPDRVGPDSTFTLNLTLRNTGRAPAAGILELALPSGMTYLGDNGTFPVTSSATHTMWNVTSLGPGTILVLGILLQAEGDPGPRSFRFLLNYTDGRGSPAVSAFSNAVAVELVAVGGTDQALPWWWWLPLLATAIPPVFFLLRRQRRIPLRLHEVFVVERGGLVLAHQSDTLIDEKDEDLVAAAFTAVQEFVRHHFSQSPDENIRTLEFGERKILLEQGGSHYVAVVFSGEEGPSLRTQVRELSEEIDRTYGYILSDWQGDSQAIRGISQLLPRLFGP